MDKIFQIKPIIMVLLTFLLTMNPGRQAMAGQDFAGQILRLQGSVEIIRDGKTMAGSANFKIYPLDEIRTGPESMAELLFQDGSSLHMGPDSRLDLTQYRFSLTEDKPSFIARMAKGLFIYVSGAISKVHPGAVKFDTPEATIGIRGTKLLIKILGSKIDSITRTGSESDADGKTVVILFKDPNGNVGRVIISNSRGWQTLDKEQYAVMVNQDKIPSEQVFVDRETLEKMIPSFLYPFVFEDYKTPLGYTPEDPLLLDNLNDNSIKPDNGKPVSVSAP
ncbi:MAG: FecR family protein [Pseudomonadota bacterium]